ncbi:MAG: hypothetical protein ACC628_28245 [Pirellulaceae bacterium]
MRQQTVTHRECRPTLVVSFILALTPAMLARAQSWGLPEMSAETKA